MAGAATYRGAGILLADLNGTDQNALYRVVTDAGLIDAFREAG